MASVSSINSKTEDSGNKDDETSVPKTTTMDVEKDNFENFKQEILKDIPSYSSIMDLSLIDLRNELWYHYLHNLNSLDHELYGTVYYGINYANKSDKVYHIYRGQTYTLARAVDAVYILLTKNGFQYRVKQHNEDMISTLLSP
jgi:hypothetical protein